MSQYLKSKILEYITRRILSNCGFTSVVSDGLYIYDRPPLQMINGKGAAHDADVLMNPPIQMPFSYSTRILFECKAYSLNRKVGIDIVRSASGLRNDINDFEIITEDFLEERQNNHRTVLAISDRKRHFYQVGIISLSGFSKPSYEFAANNKIPLLSITDLFAHSSLAAAIDNIPADVEDRIGPEDYGSLITEFSKKNLSDINTAVSEILREHVFLNRVSEQINEQIEDVYVGVLESGGLIFIKKQRATTGEDILDNNDVYELSARIHWNSENRELWWIEFNNSRTQYYFYLPKEIAESWRKFTDVRGSALEIKEQRFARFFIFNKNLSPQGFPFKLITLDMAWLRELINELNNQNL